MHLDLPVVSDHRVLEKRYRREGYIVVLVALIGIVLAACCSPVSDYVGSTLSVDIHAAFFLVGGILVFGCGCIMFGIHYLRSPEDILQEDEGKWGRRGWYTGGH